jgi:AcrR family transcriptional regulator
MDTPDMRDRILEAAERVLRSKGLAGATTRQIAREGGCADGTLYVHFRDRTELFLALLYERVPRFSEPLRQLAHRIGRRTVRANLEEAALAALEFHHHVVPLFASLFAEPEMLASYRRGLRERQGGPHRSIEAIAMYLREEQQRGRVSGAADPDIAATTLVTACFGQTFTRLFIGNDRSVEEDKRFAKKLITTLWRGLAPSHVAGE